MDRTSFIKNNIKGKTLNIGCSDGSLHKQIYDENVYGIDIKVDRNIKNFVRGDAHEMPFKNRCFDVLIAGEVIEHLYDPERFLRECKRLLQKGGILIVTTPNRKSWVNRLLKSSFHHEHISLFDNESLKALISEYFYLEQFFFLSYDEISSWGSKHKNLFWLRKMIHVFLPRGLQEEMVVKATNSLEV